MDSAGAMRSEFVGQGGALLAEDILPGFELAVSELFAVFK